jgi:molybdate transport system substrate-binding protein
MKELIKAYNKRYPSNSIKVHYGSSGKLTSQIVSGKDYDIFMSANMLYPTKLYNEHLATTKPKVYAKGAVVAITNKNIELKSDLSNLKNSSIKSIAVANPNTAPYGKASIEAIENSNKTLANKYVYTEGVSQTLQFALHATDVGFVAKSALYSPKLSHIKDSNKWISVNKSLYTPIKQGAVILNHAKDNPKVKSFYDFLFSDEAREVFKKYGYILP